MSRRNSAKTSDLARRCETGGRLDPDQIFRWTEREDDRYCELGLAKPTLGAPIFTADFDRICFSGKSEVRPTRHLQVRRVRCRDANEPFWAQPQMWRLARAKTAREGLATGSWRGSVGADRSVGRAGFFRRAYSRIDGSGGAAFELFADLWTSRCFSSWVTAGTYLLIFKECRRLQGRPAAGAGPSFALHLEPELDQAAMV